MKFEYLEHLTPAQAQSLREQSVDLDDWDFFLITHEVGEFEQYEEDEIEFLRGDGAKVNTVTKWRAKSITLNFLMERAAACDYEWRRIKWNGRDAMIGGVYHS